jgi:hypothetical protein
MSEQLISRLWNAINLKVEADLALELLANYALSN